PDANILVGAVVHPRPQAEIKLTLIATGLADAAGTAPPRAAPATRRPAAPPPERPRLPPPRRPPAHRRPRPAASGAPHRGERVGLGRAGRDRPGGGWPRRGRSGPAAL